MSVHNRECSDTYASTGGDHTESGLRTALLLTVEEVAELWFGEVGSGGSASSNCQKIRRLIPHILPARRIGNRWYISRATAEEWTVGSDPASVMAHPDTRDIAETRFSVAPRGSAD